MGAELLDFIARFAWTASWAIAAVLLTRQLMRHCFGAALAYQLWWIVPTASLATAFPTLSPTQYVLVTPALQLASYTTPAISQAGMAWCVWLLLAWAAGALAVAIGFWRAHAAFLRGLGALTEREGVHYSAAGRGPASFGLIRPRIVVPADFAQQYLPPEQTLILEHERVHIRRGDAFANLFQALLQSLLWFNPLVHLAARCFRVDQELACDAAVLRAHPGQRRNYADAMLKSQ